MILSFGTYEAARHPRVGILVDGLRSHGVDVSEVNHPIGLSTSERVRMLQQPWRLPLLLVRLLRAWTRLWVGSRPFRRRGSRPEAVLVGYMGHFDVILARLLFPSVPIVLDHLLFAADTARDRGSAGAKVRLLSLLDRLALACASVAVVDTEEHRQMLPVPGRGVVVPVGARQEWFEAAAATTPAAERRPGALSVVFFGLFTPLQGTTVIAEAVRDVLATHPGVHVTMIGDGQDAQAARTVLADLSAVTWQTWVAPEDLPEVVAAHDVCLGIFADSPKGRRVVPNKVYEGLAAGCAVVTSDTPPQRRTVADLAVLVPPRDPAALAEQLRRFADDHELLEQRRELTRRGSQRFAAKAVVGPLLDVLGLSTSGASA